MTTFVIATRNNHKVDEIRAILGGDFHFLGLRDFPGAPTVVEDAPTFAGNATKKAVELARWVAPLFPRSQITPPNRAFILADDSGLEVDALRGAPGVYSARFAALDSGQPGNSPDAENNAKLMRLLEGVPQEQRTARFRCVLALTPIVPAAPENASPVCAANEIELQAELFDGACEGAMGFAPRGSAGFGYDPLFIPAGSGKSFAELGKEEKNRISHRSKAVEKLRRWIESNQYTTLTR